MGLLRTIEHPEARFNLYVLGAQAGGGIMGVRGIPWRIGRGSWSLREITAPRRRRGSSISVDDLDAACARFEDLNINWKRLKDGGMKDVVFILDPDNYWIE